MGTVQLCGIHQVQRIHSAQWSWDITLHGKTTRNATLANHPNPLQQEQWFFQHLFQKRAYLHFHKFYADFRGHPHVRIWSRPCFQDWKFLQNAFHRHFFTPHGNMDHVLQQDKPVCNGENITTALSLNTRPFSSHLFLLPFLYFHAAEIKRPGESRCSSRTYVSLLSVTLSSLPFMPLM